MPAITACLSPTRWARCSTTSPAHRAGAAGIIQSPADLSAIAVPMPFHGGGYGHCADVLPVAAQRRRPADQTSDTLSLTSAQLADAGDYRVMITNMGCAVTSSVATLTIQTPPKITGDPEGGFFAVGSGVTLAVSATGEAPLQYQWRFNGTDIAGELHTLTSATCRRPIPGPTRCW